MGAQKSSSSILRTPFSRAGDSGSCIWDMAGRVAGILTSGTGAGDEEINDITYATPIEWLLKDITLKLGAVSSSSKKPNQASQNAHMFQLPHRNDDIYEICDKHKVQKPDQKWEDHRTVLILEEGMASYVKNVETDWLRKERKEECYLPSQYTCSIEVF